MVYRNQTQAEYDAIIKARNDKYESQVEDFGKFKDSVLNIEGVTFNHGVRTCFSFRMNEINYHITWLGNQKTTIQVFGRVNGKKIPTMYYFSFETLKRDIISKACSNSIIF
jgi:hypothetical protein